MFDISSARDFHEKLKADFSDFRDRPDSARHALNCVITAYHLHEWVWGDWLKTDYETWKALGIRDYESFLSWLDRACPWFRFIQDLANGTKHFIRDQEFETACVAGYGSGSYGVGPYGAPYLLIDSGEGAGEHRYKTAMELIEGAVRFWDDFFARYHPETSARG